MGMTSPVAIYILHHPWEQGIYQPQFKDKIHGYMSKRTQIQNDDKSDCPSVLPPSIHPSTNLGGIISAGSGDTAGELYYAAQVAFFVLHLQKRRETKIV